MVALWSGDGGDTSGGTAHAIKVARDLLMVSPRIINDGLAISALDYAPEYSGMVVSATA